MPEGRRRRRRRRGASCCLQEGRFSDCVSYRCICGRHTLCQPQAASTSICIFFHKYLLLPVICIYSKLYETTGNYRYSIYTQNIQFGNFYFAFFLPNLALFSPAKIHTRAEKVPKCKWKLKQIAICQICISPSLSFSPTLSFPFSRYSQMTQLTKNARTKKITDRK